MVEWKKLGEVCISLNKGTLKQGELIGNGKYPVINSGVSLYGRYNEYNNEGNVFTIASRGEYAGFINYSSERFWAGGLCYPYRSNEERLYLTKYLYICLKNYERKIMKTLVSRGSIPAINKTDVDNILIPIPSLEEQERIVGILDTFTASIDNIKTQIEQRRKQYEHYRNTLLTFNKDDDSVEWKTLGEIGTMYKGKGIQKSDFVDNGKPCIHYGQVHTFYGFTATKTKSFVSEEMYSCCNKAKKGDLIIATTSEDVEACCKATVWLGDSEPAISGDAHFFRHNQNPKYIGYLFMTEMFASQKRVAAVGAKVTRVHGESIMKFKFPFPSLARQQEIVSILDTFEASITNLEAQLEQKQKQYEYYREELLTNLS